MIGTKRLLARLDKISEAISHDAPAVIQDEVIKRAGMAQSRFSAAPYHGINDVTVTTDLGEKNWKIIASGEAVMFIEYGAGIAYEHTSEFGGQSFGPASWSASHARWLVDPRLSQFGGEWPVPGRKNYWTKGNPSANVMYESSKELREVARVKAQRALDKAVSS